MTGTTEERLLDLTVNTLNHPSNIVSVSNNVEQAERQTGIRFRIWDDWIKLIRCRGSFSSDNRPTIHVRPVTEDHQLVSPYLYIFQNLNMITDNISEFFDDYTEDKIALHIFCNYNTLTEKSAHKFSVMKLFLNKLYLKKTVNAMIRNVLEPEVEALFDFLEKTVFNVLI